MPQKLEFIVAGTQKAGTTTLFEYLRRHDQLSSPRAKELHFFDNETIDWRRPDYTVLEASFDGACPGRKRFEVTPIYSFWPPSLARISRYNPEMKIITLFRDPVERAWSHWCMEFARRADSLPFGVAIREGRRRLDADKLHRSQRVFTYVERGFYAEQVHRVLAHFPKKNCLFLRFDDLTRDPNNVLRQVFDFIGVSPLMEQPPIHANMRAKADYGSALGPVDFDYLAGMFRSDLIEFASLTGLPIDDWPTMTGKLRE